MRSQIPGPVLIADDDPQHIDVLTRLVHRPGAMSPVATIMSAPMERDIRMGSRATTVR